MPLQSLGKNSGGTEWEPRWLLKAARKSMAELWIQIFCSQVKPTFTYFLFKLILAMINIVCLMTPRGFNISLISSGNIYSGSTLRTHATACSWVSRPVVLLGFTSVPVNPGKHSTFAARQLCRDRACWAPGHNARSSALYPGAQAGGHCSFHQKQGMQLTQ